MADADRRRAKLQLDEHERALAAEIEIKLRKMSHPDQLRHTIAGMMSRIVTLTERMMSLRDVDVSLLHAAYRRRRTDSMLVAIVPGRKNDVFFKLAKLHTHRACSTCGSPIFPGEHAYLPEWNKSTWVRDKRICETCAETFSPIDQRDMPDGAEEPREGEAGGAGAGVGVEEDLL